MVGSRGNGITFTSCLQLKINFALTTQPQKQIPINLNIYGGVELPLHWVKRFC